MLCHPLMAASNEACKDPLKTWMSSLPRSGSGFASSSANLSAWEGRENGNITIVHIHHQCYSAIGTMIKSMCMYIYFICACVLLHGAKFLYTLNPKSGFEFATQRTKNQVFTYMSWSWLVFQVWHWRDLLVITSDIMHARIVCRCCIYTHTKEAVANCFKFQFKLYINGPREAHVIKNMVSLDIFGLTTPCHAP